MYFISRLSSVILLTWIYTEGYHDKTQKTSKNSTDALPTATTSHAPDDAPTNLAPSPLTSLTKQQRLSLFSAVKKNIYQSMFANNAVPRTRVERNNMIKAAINTASEDVLGYHPLPVKLRVHCVDVMWDIRTAFRQYAEDTVDLFFALQLTLQDNRDEIAHRQHITRSLLAQQQYAYFHLRDIVSISSFPLSARRKIILYSIPPDISNTSASGTPSPKWYGRNSSAVMCCSQNQ